MEFNSAFKGLTMSKWPERDVDHSPPPNAEGKNEGRDDPAIPTCLRCVDRDCTIF